MLPTSDIPTGSLPAGTSALPAAGAEVSAFALAVRWVLWAWGAALEGSAVVPDHMAAAGATNTGSPLASLAVRPPSEPLASVTPWVEVVNAMLRRAGLAAAVALLTINCSL